MNRILGFLGAGMLTLLVLVPAVAAAGPQAQDEHLVFNTGGSITLAAGQMVDLLVVVDGTATIEGDVRSVVVISGTARFVGSTAVDVLAIRSKVMLDGSTSVSGDIRTIDSTIERAAGSSVGGSIRDGIDVASTAVLIGSALFLVYLGFAVAAVFGALALAAIGSRQVRAAGSVISREPGTALLAALGGLVAIVATGLLAIVTIVGIPFGLALLLLVFPLLVVAGYLVAGIWIGERILEHVASGRHRERPYLAAVVGVLTLDVVGIIPIVGGVAALVGFGALILLAWRTFRESPVASVPVTAG
jgi:hypothetical protein